MGRSGMVPFVELLGDCFRCQFFSTGNGVVMLNEEDAAEADAREQNLHGHLCWSVVWIRSDSGGLSEMVKYQKYITVMQLALGVTAINKEERLPPKRKMW